MGYTPGRSTKVSGRSLRRPGAGDSIHGTDVRRPLPILLRAPILAAVMAAATHPAAPVQRSDAEVQLEFGAKVAMRGSWNEALFRFERATRLDPNLPRAWNNLAVALENLGRFEEAGAAYEKAMALAPEDRRIRENHERFTGFLKYHAKKPPEAPPADAP